MTGSRFWLLLVIVICRIFVTVTVIVNENVLFALSLSLTTETLSSRPLYKSGKEEVMLCCECVVSVAQSEWFLNSTV